jgi:hypothetical protein
MELFYPQLDQIVKAESLIAIVNGQGGAHAGHPQSGACPIMDDQTPPAS